MRTADRPGARGTASPARRGRRRAARSGLVAAATALLGAVAAAPPAAGRDGTAAHAAARDRAAASSARTAPKAGVGMYRTLARAHGLREPPGADQS
ncbi:hypothetical protein ACWEPR_26220, partial [Streptomyces sp. NPDC004290]